MNRNKMIRYIKNHQEYNDVCDKLDKLEKRVIELEADLSDNSLDAFEMSMQRDLTKSCTRQKVNDNLTISAVRDITDGMSCYEWSLKHKLPYPVVHSEKHKLIIIPLGDDYDDVYCVNFYSDECHIVREYINGFDAIIKDINRGEL